MKKRTRELRFHRSFYDSFCFQPIKTGYMLCINIREEMRQCIRIYREKQQS